MCWDLQIFNIWDLTQSSEFKPRYLHSVFYCPWFCPFYFCIENIWHSCLKYQGIYSDCLVWFSVFHSTFVTSCKMATLGKATNVVPLAAPLYKKNMRTCGRNQDRKLEPRGQAGGGSYMLLNTGKYKNGVHF